MTFDLASPDAYLHSVEDGEAIFVAMDRAAYRRSIFLDHRISPARDESWRVPLADVAAQAPPLQPAGWIFHIAHCGSTLLARALDALGAPLVLREPLALRQAAAAGDDALLDLAQRMAARRYSGAGATLVKANVPVNFALPQIAASQPQAPAIFLQHGLRDYLLAILRSDSHRQWLRRVSAELSQHLGDAPATTDAERAAALWLAQRRHFTAALATMPAARTLDAERFFAEPALALRKAADLINMAAEDHAITAVVAGDLFGTYSKNPAVRFANADRLDRRAHLATALARELDVGESWLHRNASDVDAIEAAMTDAALLA